MTTTLRRRLQRLNPKHLLLAWWERHWFEADQADDERRQLVAIDQWAQLRHIRAQMRPPLVAQKVHHQ